MPSNSTDSRPTMQLASHPAANIFPMIEDEDYRKFRADIADNGQRDPITLLDGLIIDGRNRYRACVDLGIVPSTVDLGSCDNPIAYVLSANLHRRHLSKSQASAIAAEHMPRFATEAKARLSAAQKSGGRGHKKTLGNFLPRVSSDEGKAITQAAKLVGVSRQYVADAKKLKEQSPEIYDKVKAGELTISQAKRQAVQREAPAPKEPDDINGQKIPAKLRPAFEDRKRFASIGQQFGRLLGEIESLAESNSGTFLAERLNEIRVDLKNAQAAVKFCAPHQVCPYCMGKGCATNGSKAPCRGTGWTIRGVKGPGE